MIRYASLMTCIRSDNMATFSSENVTALKNIFLSLHDPLRLPDDLHPLREHGHVQLRDRDLA